MHSKALVPPLPTQLWQELSGNSLLLCFVLSLPFSLEQCFHSILTLYVSSYFQYFVLASFEGNCIMKAELDISCCPHSMHITYVTADFLYTSAVHTGERTYLKMAKWFKMWDLQAECSFFTLHSATMGNYIATMGNATMGNFP